MKGKKLKFERILAGMTQFQISLATGIHPTTLSLIESEKRIATANEVELIRRALTQQRRKLPPPTIT